MGDVQGLEETREAPAALSGSLWGRSEVLWSGEISSRVRLSVGGMGCTRAVLETLSWGCRGGCGVEGHPQWFHAQEVDGALPHGE